MKQNILIIVFTLIILVTGFSPLNAQNAQKKNYLTVSIGKTFVHKPDYAKKRVKSGGNAGFGVGFDLIGPLSMHLIYEYHWSSKEDGKLLFSEGRITGKTGFALLKLSPVTIRSIVSPYINGGGGYVYAWEGESAGAVTYGGGVDVWVCPKLGLFFEWRHVKAHFDEIDVEGRPVKVGLIYVF